MSVLGIGISYGVATLFAMFSGMPIAFALGAVTWAERSALRRALNRLVAAGQLGKRSMYGGPRNIVWFRPKQ